MATEKQWVSLLEYAVQSGLSLSTLRRYIKSNRVEYKVEKGRYFICAEETPLHRTTDAELKRLTQDLNKAKEEIAELKTLIALYESSPQI